MTRHRRWTAIPVLSMLVLAAGGLEAASFPEAKGVSVGALGGVVFPFEGSYKTGYLVGAVGDYNFTSRLGARATFSYTHQGTTVPGGGNFTAGQFLVSGVYNFGGDRLVPFAQAGGGFYSISPPEGGTVGRVGLHLGGGVEYFLDRRTALLGQGLFHFVNGVSDRGGSSLQMGFGIRYYF